MASPEEALLSVLRRRGITTGRELCHSLGISQPTLSRLVARCRDDLVVLGRARSVRYAARDARSAFASGLPIYRVDADGRVAVFGTLVPLSTGQTAFLRDRAEPRIYAGLPWFIEELRPDGFLGRLFVRSAPPALQLSPDARLWTSEQLLRALAYCTEDVPGDLLIGRSAFDRYAERRLSSAVATMRTDFPRVVEAQLAGEAPGSSAAGEQPKFACVAASDRRLLVKYSPPIASSRAARRWADLLRCEGLALRVLRDSGHPAAQSEYVEHEGRAYLESVRFDRTTEGRVAVVTGRYLDAEFVGSGAWVPLAEGLAHQRLLPGGDAERVRFAYYFGAIIGNTDMHLGNIAFFTDDYERFRVATIYDMLPMGLRPSAQGEVTQAAVPWVHPAPEHVPSWLRAADVAATYLELVRRDTELERDICAFAEERLGQLDRIRATFAAIA